MNTQAPPILLGRSRPKPRPMLALGAGADQGGEVGLAAGRAHELTGPARRVLAALLAGRAGQPAGQGPVFWIHRPWPEETLLPEGMLALGLDPSRVTFIAARRAEDVLWTLEEVLRSGLVPVAVAELDAPPALTPVRRLHLAAEAGAAATGSPGPPVGLLLTPGEGGAAGVETRWHLAPVPGWVAAQGADPGPPAWTLSRLRARMAPPASWRMRLCRGAVELERAAMA